GHEHDAEHAVRIRLGVGERQRGSPRDSVEDPMLDAEVTAERLEVLDQRGGGVRGGLVVGGGGARPGPPATALVETDGAEPGGVHLVLPAARAEGAAGPAVEIDERDAVGAAVLLPPDLVAAGDGEVAARARG